MSEEAWVVFSVGTMAEVSHHRNNLLLGDHFLLRWTDASFFWKDAPPEIKQAKRNKWVHVKKDKSYEIL